MSKKTFFIDVYKKAIKTGKLKEKGLCRAIEFKLFCERINFKKRYSHDEIAALSSIFHQLNPTCEDMNVLKKEKEIVPYWGDGRIFKKSPKNSEIFADFTPRRQTILLFCAALNNEL